MKKRRTAAPIHSRLADEDDKVITDMFKYLCKTKKKVRSRRIIPSPWIWCSVHCTSELSFDEGHSVTNKRSTGTTMMHSWYVYQGTGIQRPVNGGVMKSGPQATFKLRSRPRGPVPTWGLVPTRLIPDT
jgi:hypothetical protein